MLEDETEPSLFFKYDYNFSTTSSSVLFDEEISNYLGRRTSLSLHNISSTPYASRVRAIFNRSKSNADIQNIEKSLTKGNNYDLVENKVKKYINDIKQQQSDLAKRRQMEEENIELENERKYLSDIHTFEQENMDSDENAIIPADQYKELFEKHKKALDVIESQRVEILKLRSSFNRCAQNKNLLEGLFRENLFENSVINTPGQSVGFNSTCVTDDICDYVSETKENVTDFISHKNYNILETNPFVVGSTNESLSSFHSDTPLLITRQKYRYHSVFHRYRRRSKIMKLFSCCHTFKNRSKIKPQELPEIVITTPTDKNSDSGNQSYKSIPESVENSRTFKTQQLTQEKLLEELIECADELSSKVEQFRNIAKQCVKK